MLLPIVVVALATIHLSAASALSDCSHSLPGELTVANLSVVDVLDGFERIAARVVANCAPQSDEDAVCCKRDYANLVQASDDDDLRAQLGEVIGDLQVGLAEKALEKCNLFTERITGEFRYLQQPQRTDPSARIDQLRKALTYLSFLKADALRLMRRFGEAANELKNANELNQDTKAFQTSESSSLLALIELGRVQAFNGQVQACFLGEVSEDLHEVDYAKFERSTSPLNETCAQISTGERRPSDSVAIESSTSSSTGSIVCNFAKVLAALKVDSDQSNKDIEDTLEELRGIDAKFASDLDERVVSHLLAGDTELAWRNGQQLARELDEEDSSNVFKQMYDLRNIWSKKHREGLRAKRKNLVSIKSYVYYLLAQTLSRAGRIRGAELLVGLVRRYRIHHEGVSADKLFRLEAQLELKQLLGLASSKLHIESS